MADVDDRRLLRIASGFRDGILSGRSPEDTCFMVCAPLQGYLATLGIQVELLEVNVPERITQIGAPSNHYVLSLPDGRILDPTADQFPAMGLPAVYLGPRPDAYEEVPA